MTEMTVTKKTRRRGEYAKSAARREEILKAGMEVFAEAGYHGGSVREVASRIGMSQAGLLHHFPTKLDLLEALLKYRDDADRVHFTIGHDDASGLDHMRGLIRLARHNMTVPGIMELFTMLSAEATTASHPAHEYFVDRYEWATRWVADSFEELRSRGQLREGLDPMSMARNLLAVMDGLQLRWLLQPRSFDMAQELHDWIQAHLTVDLDADG